MDTQRSFQPDADRYRFDFTTRQGWAQIDTSQDAPYYGNWVDPIELRATGFAEGDVTEHTFADADKLARWLWSFRLNTPSMRIDVGLGERSEAMKEALESMGCEALLHGADVIELPKTGDENRLSIANVTAESVMVPGFHDPEYGDEIEPSCAVSVVLPDLSPLQMSDECETYDTALKEALADGDGCDMESILDDAQTRWEREGHDGEWRDEFWPQMNFYWPIDLAHGVEPGEAAKRIAAHAPTVSLVELPDQESAFGEAKHALVLTGGGMDLSDQLAAAYLVCGCVPPLSLLQSQWANDQMRERSNGALWRLWLYASDTAAQYLNRIADDLVQRVHIGTAGRGLENN